MGPQSWRVAHLLDEWLVAFFFLEVEGEGADILTLPLVSLVGNYGDSDDDDYDDDAEVSIAEVKLPSAADLLGGLPRAVDLLGGLDADDDAIEIPPTSSKTEAKEPAATSSGAKRKMGGIAAAREPPGGRYHLRWPPPPPFPFTSQG